MNPSATLRFRTAGDAAAAGLGSSHPALALALLRAGRASRASLAGAAVNGAAAQQQQQQQAQPRYTCRRCRQGFSAQANGPTACRFHPEIYTGGEVAKALGFVRRSDSAQDQLGAVVGRTGLMRFWDCCGDEREDAPGCRAGFHVTFDDELNEEQGWF